MDTITRRRFLIASGVTGGAALAAGSVGVTWSKLHERAASEPMPAGSKILVDRHPLRWQRRAEHSDPVRRPGLPRRPRPAGLRTQRGPGARRRPRAESGNDGAGEGLAEQATRDRAWRRLPQPGLQPLPFDGHLADRLTGHPGQHRLDRTLARLHRRRSDPRGQRRLGAAPTRGRGEVHRGRFAGRRRPSTSDGDHDGDDRTRSARPRRHVVRCDGLRGVPG